MLDFMNVRHKVEKYNNRVVYRDKKSNGRMSLSTDGIGIFIECQFLDKTSLRFIDKTDLDYRLYFPKDAQRPIFRIVDFWKLKENPRYLHLFEIIRLLVRCATKRIRLVQ